MRTLRTLLVAMLFPALLATTSIASAQAPEVSPRALQQTGSSPLQGTRWRLVSYRSRDIVRTVGPEVAAWLQLRNGRLSGSGGCTKLRGRYSLMGAAIGVDLGRARKPDCGEQTTLVQRSMIAGLRGAGAVLLVPGSTSADTELSLLDQDGKEILRFIVDDPGVLAPDRWRLIAYRVDGVRSEADASQPAVLSFQPRERVAAQRRSSGDMVGSSGCNGIVGAYFRHADVISFGEFERTDAPCAGPAAAQEAALIRVLDSTSISLRLPPDRLVLTASGSDDQLEFISSRTLEGSTWLVTKLANGRALRAAATLRLAAGIASGEGPCGAYSGRYATDGVFISFADIEGAGDRDCPDRRVERDLLDALGRTVLSERGGSQLRMLDAAGVLTLRLRHPEAP